MSARQPSRGPFSSHSRGHAPPPRIGSSPKPGLPRRWEPFHWAVIKHGGAQPPPNSREAQASVIGGEQRPGCHVAWTRLFAEVEGSRSAESAEVSDGAGKAGPGRGGPFPNLLYARRGGPFPDLLYAPDSLGSIGTVLRAPRLFTDPEACPPLTLIAPLVPPVSTL